MNIKTKLNIAKSLTSLVPLVCSIIFVLHCILDFLEIKSSYLSYLGGTSVLVWFYFLYNSFLYSMCVYQRMFIYYLMVCNSICIVDNYYTLPISDEQYTSVFVIGFGIAVILYGILKFRENKLKSK